MDAQCRPQRAGAGGLHVLVEVAPPRRQGKRLDTRDLGAFGQCRERRVARGIGVAGDVEPTQRRREQKGGKMVGRERRRHGHGGQRTAQRQHSLDAFAYSEDIVGRAKADGVAEETAHGPPRRIDRRLAEAVRRKPGAMRAGDRAGKIGDGGDHRRPGLGRRAVVRTIVAARMEPQRARIVHSLDAAMAQVGLDECAANRLRHGDQPPRRLRRPGRDGRADGLGAAARFRAWQREEASRLLGDVAEFDETAALADHVEQVAVFGRGGIGPVPGGAGTGLRPAEPDEQRAAGCVANVAHRPVAALTPPVRQVMAADRLGLAGEATRQFGSVAGHHANPRALRLCCVEADDRACDRAQSQRRNITLAATYSVLCAVEHKTDAATGEHGDLLDIIRESCGLAEFSDVADEARRFLSLPRPDPAPEHARPSSSAPAGSPESARRLFAMSQPMWGTIAETYLRRRGITALHGTANLRFHPSCYYRPDPDSPTETWPAMIAAVTDLGGMITGAHRTWLDPSGRDKAPIDTPRRAMGHLLGNAVRFGVAHDVMAAGEGIETMLSLRCVVPTMPMVAALSAAHLAAILFPRTLRRLYIARDNDPAGDGAVANLIDRSREAGIEAITLSPRLGDFNEDLRALGIDALRAAIRVQIVPEDVVRFMALQEAAAAAAKVPSDAGVMSHPVAG